MTTTDEPGSAAGKGDRAIPRSSGGSPVVNGDLVALIGTTTRLYADCLMPNGALVEAPAHLPFFPKHARDTLRCRPGLDAAFAIVAMDAFGRDVRAPLLRWIRDRAAGFADDGLLRRAYHVHGPIADEAPDLLGTALLLYAVTRRPSRARAEVVQEVSRGLASALAVRWDGEHGRFRDLAPTDGVFRAAELAAVGGALAAAGTALDIAEWSRLADNIASQVEHAPPESVTEPLPAGDRDESVVAYLVLAWPFAAPGTGADAALAAERLMGARDVTAPVLDHSEHGPLVTSDAVRPAELFWLAVGLAAAGQRERALPYVNLGMATADASGHFPERGDPVKLGSSPRPYLLAHLLFVVAAEAVGLLAALPRGAYSGSRRP